MDQNNRNIDWGGWILTLIMLSVFWPVGIVLLIRQLSAIGRSVRKDVKRHPYDMQHGAQPVNETSASGTQTVQSGGKSTSATAKKAGNSSKKSGRTKAAKTQKVDVSRGRVLMIVGAAIAGVFGIGLAATVGEIFSWGWYSYMLEDIFALTGFFAAGLVCLGMGWRQRRQAKRFKKYLAYIGKNKSISLVALAAAMGVKEKTICDDLQDMLDSGVLPMGYIDLAAGRLVLSDEGISDFVAESETKAEPESTAKVGEDENAILQEIREVNDAIPDEVMSAKIDRIGEITGKILDYQRSHPNKSSQLRSFLNYYLPTTLKVLRAYAQLDAQGIEGENITAAKKRIEGMMDQVVDGFEKQLDKLFQDDALDIASDVEVLENMLRQDGLTGGMQMGMGGSAAETSAQQAYLDLQKIADELNDTAEDDGAGQGITLGL